MSAMARRDAIRLVWVTGIAATMLSAPAVALSPEDGFLEGTFYVRCPAGHDEKVENLTRNHDCETKVNGKECGKKSVDKGKAIVVCPDNHGGDENKVEGITRQHQCQTKVAGGGICGKAARR